MKKIISVAIAIFLALFIRTYLVQAYKIPGSSMMPALLSGDHIFVAKSHYKSNPPRRGDIAVFKYPPDKEKDFVKRIIGLPGEAILIKDNVVYINDVPLEENYTIYVGEVSEKEFGPMTIPNDALFMMGDNRNNSHDSRFWGTVKLEDMKGKVVRIYWSKDKEQDEIRWDRIWQEVH